MNSTNIFTIGNLLLTTLGNVPFFLQGQIFLNMLIITWDLKWCKWHFFRLQVRFQKLVILPLENQPFVFQDACFQLQLGDGGRPAKIPRRGGCTVSLHTTVKCNPGLV